jgi:hypothetical protein
VPIKACIGRTAGQKRLTIVANSTFGNFRWWFDGVFGKQKKGPDPVCWGLALLSNQALRINDEPWKFRKI